MYREKFQAGTENNSLFYFPKPQLSIFQSPLLEFYGIIEKLIERKLMENQVTELLLEFAPIINKFWLPSLPNAYTRRVSRTKFSNVDDRMLLISLMKYGSRNHERIKRNYLHKKSISEIKNRYKNLISSKASENMIKTWKLLCNKKLNDAELKNLEKG